MGDYEDEDEKEVDGNEKQGNENEKEDDEEDEMEYDVTAFCASPQIPSNKSCSNMGGVEWHAFGNQCFAILRDCEGDSMPAIVDTPEVDVFVSRLLSFYPNNGMCENK